MSEEKIITDNTIIEKETPIKRKLELDIDVSPKNNGDNPFIKWVHLAKTVDAWRIFPRLFLTVYIILLYKCVIWYMNLQAPTMEIHPVIQMRL